LFPMKVALPVQVLSGNYRNLFVEADFSPT
jgi:hypothetical protein